MRAPLPLTLVLILALLAGCTTAHGPGSSSHRNEFIAISDFGDFALTTSAAPGQILLVSPHLKPRNNWDELIVSWNVAAGTPAIIEARAIYPDHVTKYYTLGRWSDDPARHPRESVTNQDDADAQVLTDTLRLTRPGAQVQLRITLFDPDTMDLPLKFLGLSLCDNHAEPDERSPNHKAWGKTLPVPERVQSGYDGPGGWCSPASLSMVLAYWSDKMKVPELDRPVPEVAAAVNDPVYGGTGNWPFNTAYAGEFPGLRACVRRFDGLRDLEDCIAADIPVVLSVSSWLTNDRHDGPDNGHLIVCIGFTETGDLICNDPGVSLKNGQTVHRIYPRTRVLEAWKKSKNAVYLVYPDSFKTPK